jgi:predicted ATPase
VLGEKTLSVFLSARDVRAEAEKYWDTIALTDHEDRVTGALRIIDDVEGIRMASPPTGNGASNRNKSFPIARLKGQDRPEPLSNLGEGMNRLFALSVGLVRAEGGVLLVDEIENGLHYSVQPKLWRMIFETAQALDVQVFATTHSLDCLRAFKQVAQDRDGTESNLISLRRHEDDRENIVAVIADRDDLRAILGGKVEVR